MRMAHKSAALQRTLTSTRALRDAVFKIQSDNIEFITRFTTEITAQESDIATLSEYLPSSLASLKGWETVMDVAVSLQTELEEQLGCISQRLIALDGLGKELSGHVMGGTSRNFFHPIHRLPVEILQAIFEECVDSEAAEWFEYPHQPPELLKFATRIASTCRVWRTIAQRTPRMWNRLRVPIVRMRWNRPHRTIGLEAFQESLRLCGDFPLEMAIPSYDSLPEKLDIKSLKIDRLNIYDLHNCQRRSSRAFSFPSPRHLWVGNGNSSNAYTGELPSSLISHTATITANNLTVTIQEKSYSVTQLVLTGILREFRLTSLLESLPCLNELDASRAETGQPNHQLDQHQTLTHQRLRRLQIDIYYMHCLEDCLANGLQLPGLSCFGLASHDERFDPLHYTPSSFPSASAQLPTTVTHLEVHGVHPITTSSIRTFIDTFDKIDTISTHGNAVGTILGALCQTWYMLEDEKSSVAESPPSRIQALYIRDYRGNGEGLYPALHQIYTGIGPIKVFFENCPNILPKIRGDPGRLRISGSTNDSFQDHPSAVGREAD